VTLASVVIPAHDEAATIDRTLLALQADPAWDDLEVVVVCNGCRDDTAARAAAHGPVVQVVETPVASKAAALNLGDRAATAFPRIYLDADVEVSPGAISSLVRALAVTGMPMAGLPVRFDTSSAGRVARAYLEAWSSCPHFGAGHVGAGLYALSREGRGRIGPFPDDEVDLADDLWVMRSFEYDERTTTEGWCRPGLPSTVRDVVRVRRRHLRARRALARAVARGDLAVAEPLEQGRRWLLDLAREPRRWPSLLAFVVITSWAELTGRWQERRGRAITWERDSSTHDADLGAADAEVA
jgi:glycosyltransferase involved in cell wall biosynthesis